MARQGPVWGLVRHSSIAVQLTSGSARYDQGAIGSRGIVSWTGEERTRSHRAGRDGIDRRKGQRDTRLITVNHSPTANAY